MTRTPFLTPAERVEAFAAALARHATRLPPLIELETYFEPEAVAFFFECPDRLLCGRDAFAALRAQGLAVAPPRRPLTAERARLLGCMATRHAAELEQLARTI